MNNPTEEQILAAVEESLTRIGYSDKEVQKAHDYALNKAKIDIKSLFRKGEVWEPEEGEEVVVISGDGQIVKVTYPKFPFSRYANFLGIFPDTPEGKQQAERKLAMVKAVFPSGERFRPVEHEKYWRLVGGHAIEIRYSSEHNEVFNFNFNIGNVHRTKEEAEKYGELMSQE